MTGTHRSAAGRSSILGSPPVLRTVFLTRSRACTGSGWAVSRMKVVKGCNLSKLWLRNGACSPSRPVPRLLARSSGRRGCTVQVRAHRQLIATSHRRRGGEMAPCDPPAVLVLLLPDDSTEGEHADGLQWAFSQSRDEPCGERRHAGHKARPTSRLRARRSRRLQ